MTWGDGDSVINRISNQLYCVSSMPAELSGLSEALIQLPKKIQVTHYDTNSCCSEPDDGFCSSWIIECAKIHAQRDLSPLAIQSPITIS